MNPSRTFILRPVATSLLMIGVLLAGVVAFRQLPVALPTPPLYSKINPADTPILTLALSSETLPLATVEDLADTRLAPKISQLPGVGLVTLGGGQKPAVRVQANPSALASLGLNL